MKMNAKLANSFCAPLLLAIAFQVQKGDILDITRISLSTEEKRTGGGQGGGAYAGHIRAPKILPLRITLSSLNKSSYQLGEEVIYDVILENITKNTIVIPWSPDRDKARPNSQNIPLGYREAFLSLVVKDEQKGEQFIAGQGLFGSELLRGSLKILAPGQKVRVRAPGQWAFLDAEVARRALTSLPRKIEVWVRFNLQERQFNSQYEPAISANSIIVELRKKQE